MFFKWLNHVDSVQIACPKNNKKSNQSQNIDKRKPGQQYIYEKRKSWRINHDNLTRIKTFANMAVSKQLQINEQNDETIFIRGEKNKLIPIAVFLKDNK